MAFDFKTQEILSLLYSGLRDPLEELLNQAPLRLGLSLRLTSGFRTISEQQALFDQGRTTAGPKVTNAEPWQSFHSYGLASDICIQGKDPYLSQNPRSQEFWEKLGLLGESLGMQWGGRFKAVDKPHFEMNYGLYWENCQSLCEDDGLAHLWSFLDKKRGITPGHGWQKTPALYRE